MLIASNNYRRLNKVQKIFLTYLCYRGNVSSSFFSTNSNRNRSDEKRVHVGVHALNICIIAGSTRTNGPPRPILSDRVTAFIQSSIANRDAGHEISILKAKDNIILPNEDGDDPNNPEISTMPLLERPHFTYPESQMPDHLKKMHETLAKADAYIAITPEYNHSPCPGLMNLMNHFGSSTFGFKPSAIVSYSAGQWGGTRAAHSLRPFLSELGCLPVSAMVHIPNAANVLKDDGQLISMDIDEQERWSGYVDRLVSQVEWWGEAARSQRNVMDPYSASPAFRASPSQRNAPN